MNIDTFFWNNLVPEYSVLDNICHLIIWLTIYRQLQLKCAFGTSFATIKTPHFSSKEVNQTRAPLRQSFFF